MPEAGPPGGLSAAAAKLGVELSDDEVQRLHAYAQLLTRWNEKFNLISRRDVGRLLSRHVLDSLSIDRWLHGARVLDIGSGAGLPGVPLAIVNSEHVERRFVLVDRSERKARFLHQAALACALDNVSVRCCDAGDLVGEAPFTTIVCRAVAGLDQVWQIAEPLLEPGGRLLFMNRTAVHAQQGGQAETSAPPCGSRVVRQQVQIPGLTGSHEVLLLEARA